MLNSDVVYMSRDKFKLYKQKLPPTKEFLSHCVLRCSEITYRTFLFSIFWTVCGGIPFSILLFYEICFIIFWLFNENEKFNIHDWQMIFLGLNQIIVLPPELIFEQETFYCCADSFIGITMIYISYCFSGLICGCTMIPPYCKDCKKYLNAKYYFYNDESVEEMKNKRQEQEYTNRIYKFHL